jgi:hypothetical protein
MFGAMKAASAPALAALLLMLAATDGTASTAAHGPRAQAPAASDTLTGTVRSINPAGDGMDVISGFHMALKVTYVRLDATTRIEHAGASLRREELKPGAVVRIRYRRTDQGLVAESVEVISEPETGGER